MLQRRLFLILSLAPIVLFSACSDSMTGADDEPMSEIEIQQYEDLDAVGTDGSFTFFSLLNGGIVASEDSATTGWDIAIRGTTILTNSGVSGPGDGGAILLDVPFDEVSIAPESGYSTDSEESLAIPTGSGNGWYSYTGQSNPQFAILPIENKTIVLKSGNGRHYAKLEIISYYKGNPDAGSEEFASLQTRPDGRFYTFRYAIQQTEGLRELQ